jgi:hypothetical protein
MLGLQLHLEGHEYVTCGSFNSEMVSFTLAPPCFRTFVCLSI